jgi:hypothetical protein
MLSDFMARSAEENLALQWRGAKLLLAIAGDARDHIEMSRTGDKKYYSQARPLTEDDTLAHLQGRKTVGASCGYGNGTTRALCYDTDTAEGWQQLTDAAEKLADAGYKPLLEQSPAQRGGHLWIVFSGRVNVTAARNHAHSIAAELAAVTEYWPAPVGAKKWNRVRLPGGKYIRPADEKENRPAINAWCKLIDVMTGETARNGVEAAALLLSRQTEARIVPELTQDTRTPERLGVQTPERLQQPQERPAARPSGVDERWRQTYGSEEGKRLWFAWTAPQLAQWWNETHEIDDLLPDEKRGYGSAVWRGETDPSVAKRDGRWADFGQSARRPDGNPDTGDALELQQRLTQLPKPEVMRRAAKELLSRARADLEAAARVGQPIPFWLEMFITDAGRAYYEALRPQHDRAQDKTKEQPPRTPAREEVSEEARQLMEARGLTHGEPCGGCACELYRDLAGSPACVRCFPVKDYHEISGQVDLLYPRKKAVSFGRDREFGGRGR